MNLSPTALALAGLLAACAASKPEPEIASSAAQSGYALAYPADVQAMTKDFGESQAEVTKSSQAFAKYPSELKDPDWSKVLEIVHGADDAGKSWAYVERLREVQGAQSFLSEEKDEITRKVAGSAQYVVKQKGCDVDVSGAIVHSFKETVDKQLEKRLREANEGQRRLDRYRESLGKENAAALERQADDIAYASYLVHVAMVEHKLRLRRMVEEAEAVKKTADEDIEAERKYQAEPKRSDADKKASEERITAMNKSKALIDSAVTQAKSASEGMEERIQASQKEYDDAIKQLFAAIEAKGGSAK